MSSFVSIMKYRGGGFHERGGVCCKVCWVVEYVDVTVLCTFKDYCTDPFIPMYYVGEGIFCNQRPYMYEHFRMRVLHKQYINGISVKKKHIKLGKSIEKNKIK